MDSAGVSPETRVIKKSQVQVTGSGTPVAAAGAPSVRLREEGGKVRGLEVQCPCGGKIQIDLDFAANPGTAPQG